MQGTHKRTSKVWIAFLIIMILFFFISLWALLILDMSGTACADYDGIALDSKGNIYLGKSETIEVVSPDGSVLRSFSSPTSRGYEFYIENDILCLSTGTDYYELSLFGDIQREEKMTSEIHMPFAEKLQKRTYLVNGKILEIRRSQILRDRVYLVNGQEKQMYFQMPAKDYALRLGFRLFHVIGPLFAGICMFWYFNHKGHKHGN